METFTDIKIQFHNKNEHSDEKDIIKQKRKDIFEAYKKGMMIRKNILGDLRGELTKIVGGNTLGFDNSSLDRALFDKISFLHYCNKNRKIFLSDRDNHIIRSIQMHSNISHNQKWGVIQTEVGYLNQMASMGGNPKTSGKLYYPRGFCWDKNDNMYICNYTCVCKVDSKSNQLSLLVGHETDEGYKDGNNDEARFNFLGDLLFSQQYSYSPLVLYLVDSHNHCIRMVDVANGITTTFSGIGNKEGDEDGTLNNAKYRYPYGIVKDTTHDVFYISDSWNNKIKCINHKNGTVTTFVGGKTDRTVLKDPSQMQIIGQFIYVACFGYDDCIVRVNTSNKQVLKIKFKNQKLAFSMYNGIFGIAHDPSNHCLYICDKFAVYMLE